ncbi:MAG: hypothetical protein HY291_10345 [Planctomycetes bacterium]|nr:hypothetical protein [Planctomycetota bacterium]
MYFISSLFLLVLSLRVLLRAKKPMALAALFALLVWGVHAFIVQTSSMPAPHDMALRAGVRFLAAWLLFVLANGTKSVWGWMLVIAFAPLVSAI